MLRIRILNWITSVLFTVAFASPVFANQTCEGVFTESPSHISAVNGSEPVATSKDLLDFVGVKANLWTTIGKLPVERQSQVEHLLASVEFFDYQHMSPHLLSNFLNDRKQSIDFSRLYDDKTSQEGFLKSLQF